MKKYKTFSEGFYLVILFLTIPFYLILYGASGHEFKPEPEDVIWMIVIITAITSMIAYLFVRKFNGIGVMIIKILFVLTLMCMLFGGLSVLWFLLHFKFDENIFFLIQILFYGVPILFIYSALNIGYWLIRDQKPE